MENDRSGDTFWSAVSVKGSDIGEGTLAVSGKVQAGEVDV